MTKTKIRISKNRLPDSILELISFGFHKLPDFIEVEGEVVNPHLEGTTEGYKRYEYGSNLLHPEFVPVEEKCEHKSANYLYNPPYCFDCASYIPRTPSPVVPIIEQIGELKVHNFKCSKHGVINPIPKCPGCLKFPMIEELKTCIQSVPDYEIESKLNEVIRAVNLLRK